MMIGMGEKERNWGILEIAESREEKLERAGIGVPTDRNMPAGSIPIPICFHPFQPNLQLLVKNALLL